MPAIVNRALMLRCRVVGMLDNVILCQRDDNTFITWRVSVHNGMADFVSGCYDMAQAAGNANLIERAFGEQPAPVKTYVVWSADHVAMLANATVETYEQLTALEDKTGYGYSSVITTDDISGIADAIQNEWNGDMLYHEVEAGA